MYLYSSTCLCVCVCVCGGGGGGQSTRVVVVHEACTYMNLFTPTEKMSHAPKHPSWISTKL